MSEMLTWLHVKYGQISNVCSRSIEYLETSKVPGGGSLENFYIEALNTLEFVRAEKQSALLTAEKTMKIGNNIFSERAKEDFANSFLDLQEDLETKFVVNQEYSTFGSAWAGSFFCEDFINLLLTFIKKQIKLRKTLAVGMRTSSAFNANVRSFKCPCCGGQHLDRNNRPRNYLSVCTRFNELSVQ